jgi:aryl-alcohol dehydrogenase-like predicted oxidoreductase
VLPTCQRHGLAVMVWSPLNGGWLSGRWRLNQELPGSSRAATLPRHFDPATPANQRKLEIVDELAQLAEESSLTLVQFALAWVIRHPGVTSAIIGPRTMEHLESQLGADEVVLADEVLDRIDKIMPPGQNANEIDTAYVNSGLRRSARRRPAGKPVMAR